MFSDITNVTNAQFDARSMMWIKSENRRFEWNDIHTTRSGEFFSMDRYYVPSMYETSFYLPATCAFYFVLSWYFD
jgi:hypothetical protein